MKRMIAFFIVSILLVGAGVYKQNVGSLFDGYTKLVVVSKEALAGQNYLKNDNLYYYTLEGNQKARELFNQNYLAYNFYFPSDYKIENITNNLDFFYQGGSSSGYTIYYGYFMGYSNFNYIGNKKINIQIVNTGSEVIVGLPLIVTGY